MNMIYLNHLDPYILQDVESEKKYKSSDQNI